MINTISHTKFHQNRTIRRPGSPMLDNLEAEWSSPLPNKTHLGWSVSKIWFFSFDFVTIFGYLQDILGTNICGEQISWTPIFFIWNLPFCTVSGSLMTLVLVLPLIGFIIAIAFSHKQSVRPCQKSVIK